MFDKILQNSTNVGNKRTRRIQTPCLLGTFDPEVISDLRRERLKRAVQDSWDRQSLAFHVVGGEDNGQYEENRKYLQGANQELKGTYTGKTDIDFVVGMVASHLESTLQDTEDKDRAGTLYQGRNGIYSVKTSNMVYSAMEHPVNLAGFLETMRRVESVGNGLRISVKAVEGATIEPEDVIDLESAVIDSIGLIASIREGVRVDFSGKDGQVLEGLLEETLYGRVSVKTEAFENSCSSEYKMEKDEVSKILNKFERYGIIKMVDGMCHFVEKIDATLKK